MFANKTKMREVIATIILTSDGKYELFYSCAGIVCGPFDDIVDCTLALQFAHQDYEKSFEQNE